MAFEIDTKAIHPSDEKEHLFTIDGTKYYIPKKIGAEVGIRATLVMEEKGEVAATLFCVDHTIGRKAYEALAEVEGLPKKTFEAILSVCREKVFGGMEEEGKG